MKIENIKTFFENINELNLSYEEKERMMNLIQVRGSNKKNKVMSYKEFKNFIISNKGKITKLVLGPKWSRLVFVNVDIEVNNCV